jgi:PKD repeat protein
MRPKASQRLVSIVLIALGISLSALPAAALHWSGSGAFGPSTAYQGATTIFTFTLHNQASGTLDVSWVWVHFCWEVSNVGYYFKPNDGSTVSVSGGSYRDFSGAISVDQTTLGTCAVTIQANGRAGGDLYFETATYSGSISVLQVPPLQVSISANPNNGQAPLAVSFSSTVTGGLGPYTYAWTFGDGGTSSLANPAYSYQTSGTYTVTLVVTDSMSNQKSATATVTVTTPGFGSGVISGLGIFVWIIVAIVVIAIGVGVGIVLRRRRHVPPPPMPPSP